MGGGSKTTTQKVDRQPWAPAQDSLKRVIEQANELYDRRQLNPKKPNEAQLKGVEALAEFYKEGGGMAQLYDRAKSVMDAHTADPMETVYSKPVQDMIESRVGGIAQQLRENLLPAIGRQATGAGQYGGSRQGLAEGVAIDRGAESAARVSADLTNAIYQNALNRQLQAAGLAPMMTALGSARGEGMLNVGNLQEALASMEERDAANALDEFNARIYPIANVGGTTVQTTKTPGRDPLSTAIGLGGTLMSGVLAAKGMGLFGAGAGAGAVTKGAASSVPGLSIPPFGGLSAGV